MKHTISKISAISVISLAVLSLVGCAPRGETKSLDEVVQIARTRFEQVKGADVPADAKPVLDKTIATLQSLLDSTKSAGANYAAPSQEVAEGLSTLVSRAGYTSRVSMTELIRQYREIAKPAANAPAVPADVNQNRVKLLVSRTLSLIASELETTKFAIS